MSVVLAVIASYSRCFVRMLPVNWLLTSSSVSVWANISSKSVAVDKRLRRNIGLRCDAAFSHFQTDIAYYYLFWSLPVFKRQISKQANVALHSLYRMVYLFLFQEEKWIRYSRKTKGGCTVSTLWYIGYIGYNFWMAWDTTMMFTSKCAQMNLLQLPKM